MDHLISVIERWLSVPFSRDVLLRIAPAWPSSSRHVVGAMARRGLDRVMIAQRRRILRKFRVPAYALALVIVFIAASIFPACRPPPCSRPGCAGLGIGLALKDSLSNVASGVM